MKKIYKLIACVAIASTAWSCSTPKDVTYVQDITQGTYTFPTVDGAVKARPDDKLEIVVNSKDDALASLFNIHSQDGSGNKTLYYTVDNMGNINFPVLGEIHVAGLTRSGIAGEIKNMLVSRDLVKDPTVTVEFANAMINVLGEVSNPGRYNIDRDHITIFDGLAMAGDLTINGERNNVAVLRQTPDGRTDTYRIDLTSAESIYSSPAYYLQQSDVVYVEPNDTRKRQRSANGNNVFTPTFWISIASFLTTLGVLIWR